MNRQQFNPTIKQDLIQSWLPQLHELESKRKPLSFLMISILIIPIILVIILAIKMIIFDGSFTESITVIGILISLNTICFVYFGKIQSSNDNLLIIEALFYAGDKDVFLKACSELTSFGQLEGILEDVKKFIRI